MIITAINHFQSTEDIWVISNFSLENYVYIKSVSSYSLIKSSFLSTTELSGNCRT
jgi:hypothetical protein